MQTTNENHHNFSPPNCKKTNNASNLSSHKVVYNQNKH